MAREEFASSCSVTGTDSIVRKPLSAMPRAHRLYNDVSTKTFPNQHLFVSQSYSTADILRGVVRSRQPTIS